MPIDPILRSRGGALFRLPFTKRRRIRAAAEVERELTAWGLIVPNEQAGDTVSTATQADADSTSDRRRPVQQGKAASEESGAPEDLASALNPHIEIDTQVSDRGAESTPSGRSASLFTTRTQMGRLLANLAAEGVVQRQPSEPSDIWKTKSSFGDLGVKFDFVPKLWLTTPSRRDETTNEGSRIARLVRELAAETDSTQRSVLAQALLQELPSSAEEGPTLHGLSLALGRLEEDMSEESSAPATGGEQAQGDASPGHDPQEG